MNMIIFKIMFFLAIPWMYLASLFFNIYRRLTNKETYYTDYEIMSGMYNWIMPIGAILTAYTLVYLISKLFRLLAIIL